MDIKGLDQDFDGDTTCTICGQLFARNTQGRPSLYCGKDCRDTASAISLLQNRLDSVQAKSTDKNWKNLRAVLFRLGNHRGVSDKTGPRRMPGVRNELIAQIVEENYGRIVELHWSPLRVCVVADFELLGQRTFDIRADVRCSQRRREDRMIETLLEQVRALSLVVC